MTEDQVIALLTSGRSANSIFTVLGKALAKGELNWLLTHPEISIKEQLYLYVSKKERPSCLAVGCINVPAFKGYTRGYQTFCSTSCARTYGFQTNGAAIHEKMKATLLKNHGVNSPFKVEGAVEKHHAAMIATRGRKVKQETLAQIKQTCIDRYGVENPGMIPAVRERVANTMNERYGGYYLAVNGNEHKHKAWTLRKTNVLLTEFNTKLLEPIDSSKDKYRALCLSCHEEFNLNIANGDVSRCPKCFFIPANRSKKEAALSTFIHELGFTTITNAKSKELIWPYSLDAWIPSKRIAIEFNGDYWHREEHKGASYHLDKLKSCIAKGIKLIQVFEHEFDYKRELVNARIKSIFGVIEQKLYARNCQHVEVNAADARAFLDRNHLQGFVSSALNLGLAYKGELVMLMTVGKPRYNLTAELELLRLCTKRELTVVGGVSKLLKQLKQLHLGKTLLTYHDRRWGESSVYEALGFIKGEPSPPSYIYIKNGIKLSRYQAQKHKLPKLLGEKFSEALTESENMSKAGYHKLYDCGQHVYTMTL
jgi:transposase-like protein